MRSIGFLSALLGRPRRRLGRAGLPHLRYSRSSTAHAQEWQFKCRTTPLRPLGSESKTVTHDHLAPEDWEDLAGGERKLCCDEIPTKVNWHDIRFDFELAAMRAAGFSCSDW